MTNASSIGTPPMTNYFKGILKRKKKLSFKEFIEEKANIIANGGWLVLKIDESNMIMTNVELIKDRKVQIATQDKEVKVINIGKCLITTLQDEGFDIDIKDKNVKNFINQIMYNCNCKI